MSAHTTFKPLPLIALIAAGSLALGGCESMEGLSAGLPADMEVPADFLADDEGALADAVADAEENNAADEVQDEGPLEDDAASARPELRPDFAVLASDNEGTYDIVILDGNGDEQQRIDANIYGAQYLDYHRDGFFLVTAFGDNGSLTLKVEMTGQVEVLFDANSEAINQEYGGPLGPIYQIDETLAGVIVMAAEHHLIKLFPNGSIQVDVDWGETCWMDVIAAPIGSDAPVVLDIISTTLELAQGTDEGVETETLLDFENSSLQSIAQDESGAYWLGGWSNELTRVVDGEQQLVADISNALPGASAVISMDGAGDDSVFILYEDNEGSGIAQVNADGGATVIVNARWDLWIDMVPMQ